jgi:hypothetical protein
MPDFPYIPVLKVVLAASGAGVCSLAIPQNENHDYRQIRVTSTGAFVITDISTGQSNHFTNANSGTPIPYHVFQDPLSPNIGIISLDVPLHIDGGQTLNIYVTDTSGAGNTINFVLVGVRHT